MTLNRSQITATFGILLVAGVGAAVYYWGFRARGLDLSSTTSVVNQARVKYCTASETAPVCDPANGVYSGSATSNTVTTQVAAAVQPPPAQPTPAQPTPSPNPTTPVASNLSLDTDGTVYLINNSKRFPITGEGFKGWNFSWSGLHSMTSTERAYPTQPRLTELVLEQKTGSVYYIDAGKKRPIASARIFDRWGFSWSHVSPAAQDLIDQIPWGLPTHELTFPTDGDGTVYLATASNLYPISGSMFRAWGFSFSEIGKIPGSVIKDLNMGPLLSRFALPEGGDGTIYLLDQGRRYAITGAAAAAWKFDLSTTRKVGPPLLNEAPYIGKLSTFVTQAGGDGTIFLIQDGKKYPLSAAAFKRRAGGASVQNFSAELLNTLPTQAKLTS